MPNKGKKRKVCPQCDEVYFNDLTYKIHLRQHSNLEIENISCSTCNKKFFGDEQYYNHILSPEHQYQRLRKKSFIHSVKFFCSLI
jgi:RNase P subunit RPR2